MKASEFKLCLVSGVNNLIDDYFGTHSMADKFINSTLKIILEAKPPRKLSLGITGRRGAVPYRMCFMS